MYANNKFKVVLLSFIFAFLTASNVFSLDEQNYIELAQSGTLDQIQKTFKKTSGLKNQTFGESKETFLMLALRNDRNFEIIEAIVKAGCKLSAKSKEKRTPLMYAARFSTDPAVMQFIIDKSALTKWGREKEVLRKDVNKNTSFYFARKNQNPEIYAMLTNYAKEPEEPLSDGEAKGYTEKNTPEATVENENIQEQPAEPAPAENAPTVEKVEKIVPPKKEVPQEKKAQIKSEKTAETIKPVPQELKTEKPKEQKIEKPATKESKPVVKEPNPTPRQVQKETKPAQNPQPYKKSYLFDYITDTPAPVPAENKSSNSLQIDNVNKQDSNGVTLLMKAAKAGNDWDVQNLLNNNADVQLRDKDGWSALMYAVRYQNNMNIINMLIEKGAHVRIRNKYNSTPLLIAANYSQNPEILALLLKNRTSSEDEVFTAFILALTSKEGASHVQEAKIKLFIDMGISINRIWKGKTPLMYACQYGNSTEVISMLLNAGAKVSVLNAEGKNAFDYAKDNSLLPHNDVYWSLNSIGR